MDVKDLTIAAGTVSPFDAPEPANLAGPMVVSREHFPTNARIDELEQVMMRFAAAECPLRHSFTPGLYSRTIKMPAGSIITSKIHRTEHPYIVSVGRCSVWIEGEGWVEIVAPYHGITKPGTRRVLVIHEDTVWTTFHPTHLTDLEAIEDEIIQPRRGHLAGLEQPIADAVAALKKGEMP